MIKATACEVCILIGKMFICCLFKMQARHPNKHAQKVLHIVAPYSFESAQLKVCGNPQDPEQKKKQNNNNNIANEQMK